MVAPNQAMRIGGGGVTYTLDADPEKLKATLLSTAQWAKSQKMTPQLDIEQTTIVAQVERVRRAIQRETFKAKAVVELDRQGLGDIARQLGIIKIPVQAQYVSNDTGMSYDVSRAHRVTGFNADVRRATAEQLREARATRYRAGVQNEVLRRTATEGYDDTGLEYGPQNRPPAPSALSRLFTAANAIRLGFAGAAAHYALQGAGAFGGIGRGFALAGSSDTVSSLRGQMGTIDAAKSIPGIGSFVGALDELAGATRTTASRINSILSTEGRAVRMAGLTGDPVAAAAAEGNAAMLEARRNVADAKANVSGMLFNHPYFLGGGLLATKAAEDNAAGQATENAARMDIAGRAQSALLRGLVTSGGAATLSGQFRPQAAFIANLRTQLANADQTAAPFMRDMLAPMRGITGGMFGIPKINLHSMVSDSIWHGAMATLKREGSLSEFSALTPIGASELTAQFRGNAIAGDTFSRLRALQNDVDTTPDEMIQTEKGPVSMRALKRAGALSSARAMGSQLEFQQGGQAQRINAGLGQSPDALVHTPAFEARLEARRMTAEFVRNNGGIAGQEFSPLSELKETNALMRQLISLVGKLKDNGQGATPMIQTPPRGGARRDNE